MMGVCNSEELFDSLNLSNKLRTEQKATYGGGQIQVVKKNPMLFHSIIKIILFIM
jgi:hypothetical protein